MKTLLLLVLAATALKAQAAPVVLIGDYGLDGRGGVMGNAHITVEHGKITSLSVPAKLPANATTIDLRGYTVLPGWIDTHVHLDSHFDRPGRVAGRNEPPAEAALAIQNNAWLSLMAGFTT